MEVLREITEMQEEFAFFPSLVFVIFFFISLVFVTLI